MVNDYLQPPKTGNRMTHGLALFERAQDELDEVSATTPHELMRFVEASFIRDCAEMAARASLYRTESRWGLYHHRLDYPEMDDANWFVHVDLYKDADGRMAARKRPVAPYIVSLDDDERRSYYRIRVPAAGAAAPWFPRRRPRARRSAHESFVRISSPIARRSRRRPRRWCPARRRPSGSTSPWSSTSSAASRAATSASTRARSTACRSAR